MSLRCALLWWALCSVTACQQEVVVANVLEGSTAPPAPSDWGSYTAGLAIPACDSDDPLVVSSLGMELDGGERLARVEDAGSSLSLVEALTLASNRPGRDTVLFDGDLFPPATPQVLEIEAGVRFPGNLGPVCIDARGRGVQLRWTFDEASAASIWSLGSESLQVGLVFLNLPFEQSVSDAQVAGCRYGTDGTQVGRGARPWALNVGGSSVVGPGNVFAAPREPVRVLSARSPIIRDNFFGYDPLTQRTMDLQGALDLRDSSDPVLIQSNLFAITQASVDTTAATNAVLRDNRFGVDERGERLPGIWAGIGPLAQGQFVIGPGNIVRGVGTGVLVGAAQVRITRNRIYENQTAIAFTTDPSLEPPTVTGATGAQIEGTCTAAGVVEVFADAKDQSEFFVGDVVCQPGVPWVLAAEPPPGLNLTATLTAAERTSALSAAFGGS